MLIFRSRILATHRVPSSELRFTAPLIVPLKVCVPALQPAANGTQLVQFISPKRPFVHPTLSAFHHWRMLEVLPLTTNSTHEIRSLQLGLPSYTTEDSTYIPGLLFCRLELSQKSYHGSDEPPSFSLTPNGPKNLSHQNHPFDQPTSHQSHSV